MRVSRIVIDANVIVAILTKEKISDKALSLWKKIRLNGVDVYAPCLLMHEVTSAIYRKAYRSLISWDEAREAVNLLTGLKINLIDWNNLSIRAFELAREFGRPTTYDAHYLALAEHLEVPLWTADEKLFNSVKSRFKWIRLLNNYDPTRTPLF